MDQLMTKEESYADRRQLFKNIWETALNIDAKEADIMNKPKVINSFIEEDFWIKAPQKWSCCLKYVDQYGTLRLDEVDRCMIGKKKKQRIKNLRTICNRILDFCDRQDADDKFYEQMTTDGPLYHKFEIKSKKKKPIRTRKKMMKAKSTISPPKHSGRARNIASDRQDVLLANISNKSLRNMSPMKIKATTLVKKQLVGKVKKAKHSNKNLKTPMINKTHLLGDSIETDRKVFGIKLSNRKMEWSNIPSVPPE